MLCRTAYATSTIYVDAVPISERAWWMQHVHPKQPQMQPTCLENPDTPSRRNSQEDRQGYWPAAPIQRFNNKWFRHFRAVADVHGWDKNQRALQLVSYLDETAMNVTQKLGDDELYDYDILVKLLGDWFDLDISCLSIPVRFPFPATASSWRCRLFCWRYHGPMSCRLPTELTRASLGAD